MTSIKIEDLTLSQYMGLKEISIKDIAKKMHIPTYYRVVKKKAKPHKRVLVLMASILEISVETLLKLLENEYIKRKKKTNNKKI